MNVHKYLKTSFIFLIIFGWVFSGWPRIWQNPSIPPKIQKAQAATATYDFSVCGTNCDTSADWWASGDDVDVFPFAGSTANRNTHTEATDAQYTALSISDNSRYATLDPGAADEIFLWNEMKINEEVASITQIDLTFEGYLAVAANFTIWVKKTGQAYELDASWVQVGTAQAIPAATETTFTRSITTNFSDYIGADGMLTWAVYEDVSTELMNIDYVKAVVTYTPPPVVTVGTTGTQTANMSIPSTNQYVGGAFTFVRDAGTATTTQIIITDAGTVNANLNLSNVDLYYETAATCTYDANETLFGTGTTFNASEKSTITGTMSVGTSQVCVYVVLDVGSGASANQTIEIEISNPSTEITVSNGTVSPATAVLIDGTTTLQVAATVSCTASTSTTDFGILTTSAVSTSTPNITLTSSCTYAGGCTITVKDLGDTSNPGLNRSTSPPHLINSADATLTINVEGYGIQATTTGSLTLNPKYNKINNDVGGLTTPSSTNLATSTTSYADQTIIITHKAAISNLTSAGDYGDTITYSCTGN